MDVHPTKNVSIGIDPYPTCKNDGFTVFFHFFFSVSSCTNWKLDTKSCRVYPCLPSELGVEVRQKMVPQLQEDGDLACNEMVAILWESKMDGWEVPIVDKKIRRSPLV